MTSVITAQQLTMRFRGCDALRGVDFAIEPGSVFALLGENGAGKTTMIRIMTGFQKPTSGQCTVCGIDPTRRPLEVRRRIGYVSDAPALYEWMSVGEIGWFTASFYASGFLDHYRDSIRRYEIPEDRKIRHLSKGQRAKVALSLALAHDPELLILDEPTSGLDPMVRRDFLESMIDRAASGRTVFLSSHQINIVPPARFGLEGNPPDRSARAPAIGRCRIADRPVVDDECPRHDHEVRPLHPGAFTRTLCRGCWRDFGRSRERITHVAMVLIAADLPGKDDRCEVDGSVDRPGRDVGWLHHHGWASRPRPITG